MTWQITSSLEAKPGDVSAARHLLENPLGALPSDRIEDARLILTELVSNAVRHGQGRQEVEMRVRWDGRSLRVEVRSVGAFHARAMTASPEGGWGLKLIDALADRWGVDSGPVTTVWAELQNRQPTPQ
jgi:serine/threonine-protein kinase RsbW